jgi:hypothetical protein
MQAAALTKISGESNNRMLVCVCVCVRANSSGAKQSAAISRTKAASFLKSSGWLEIF